MRERVLQHSRGPDPSGAVAALELLAGAAPAGVVAADVAVIVDDLALRRRLRERRRLRPQTLGLRGPRPPRSRPPRPPCRARTGDSTRCCSTGCSSAASSGASSTWKSVSDDLLADEAAELLEHRVPLAAVLDERVLLRHRAEMDALAEVVHRLEVLAPACVDDLEDDEALDLAHQLHVRLRVVAEELLALVVRVERVLDELLDQRLTREVDLLAELLERDVACRRAPASG